jgi:hypothetical protein
MRSGINLPIIIGREGGSFYATVYDKSDFNLL